MSCAWPFWKEPPESPLASSWRSTTRHLTASWTCRRNQISFGYGQRAPSRFRTLRKAFTARNQRHAAVRAREERDQSKEIIYGSSRLFHKSVPKTCCVLVLHKTQLLIMNVFMGYWPLQPCCSFACLMAPTMDCHRGVPLFFGSPSESSNLVSVKKLHVSDAVRSIFLTASVNLPQGDWLAWIWISFNFLKCRINKCFFNSKTARTAETQSLVPFSSSLCAKRT